MYISRVLKGKAQKLAPDSMIQYVTQFPEYSMLNNKL